jgi:hypothetical protein
MVVPWRDPSSGLKLQFAFDGYQPASGEEAPTCNFRPISPRFFAVLGVPIVAGRDFRDDEPDTLPVAMVSRSLAQRVFPNGDAINRYLTFGGGRSATARRIVGVVADVDDQNVVQEPALTVYVPYRQFGLPSRFFVRAAGDPNLLIPSVTRTIRMLSADQAVERPATLEEVRAQVLAPERLNAFVFSAFGGIALLIAVVGVAGVLAFSVSGRTREFGIRMAVGSQPSAILGGVLLEGVVIGLAGVLAGCAIGFVIARVAQGLIPELQSLNVWPLAASAALLLFAAVAASLVPAMRAARVDVIQALRAE